MSNYELLQALKTTKKILNKKILIKDPIIKHEEIVLLKEPLAQLIEQIHIEGRRIEVVNPFLINKQSKKQLKLSSEYTLEELEELELDKELEEAGFSLEYTPEELEELEEIITANKEYIVEEASKRSADLLIDWFLNSSEKDKPLPIEILEIMMELFYGDEKIKVILELQCGVPPYYFHDMEWEG